MNNITNGDVWQIGGPEHRQVVDSFRALIAEGVARDADHLTTRWGYSPVDAVEIAAGVAAKFWYWTIADAIADGAAPRRDQGSGAS